METFRDALEEFDDRLDGSAEAEAVANGTSTPSSSRKRKSRDDDDGLGLGIHMRITQGERQWAEALKEALAEGEDTVNIPITDMDIVQYAIVERGDIAKCLDRIKKMNEFKTKYGIEETVEQGVESIKNFIEQHPGFLLNIDQCAQRQHYVQVMDFAKFNPRKVVYDKDWKVFLSGMHYLMTALNPTLSAVRNGLVGICECEGMGWDNFCMDFERRLWYEHPTVYPAKWHELSWVRTPTAANILFSLLKPIMPAEIREVASLGVQFDESFDGRLDALFLQPSVEEAIERQISTTESFLTKRYHNQAHFKL